MKTCSHFCFIFAVATAAAASSFSTLPLEGRITATLTRGSDAQNLLYTASTNSLRIERQEIDRPYARDIVDLQSGEITLVFPHNHSFVRLRSASENAAAALPGIPVMPAIPSGIGPGPFAPGIGPTDLQGMSAPRGMPQTPAALKLPPGVGPRSAPRIPAMAAMPTVPPMPMMKKMELKSTGETTNMLGFDCEKFELKQSGEVMEIWATDRLLPFHRYLPNQIHHFGPLMIEEQWGDLLKTRRLFPLLAVLRLERPSLPGTERLRFEVKSIAAGKINDGTLFQPPPDYHEIRPSPR